MSTTNRLLAPSEQVRRGQGGRRVGAVLHEKFQRIAVLTEGDEVRQAVRDMTPLTPNCEYRLMGRGNSAIIIRCFDDCGRRLLTGDILDANDDLRNLGKRRCSFGRFTYFLPRVFPRTPHISVVSTRHSAAVFDRRYLAIEGFKTSTYRTRSFSTS